MSFIHLFHSRSSAHVLGDLTDATDSIRGLKSIGYVQVSHYIPTPTHSTSTRRPLFSHTDGGVDWRGYIALGVAALILVVSVAPALLGRMTLKQ